MKSYVFALAALAGPAATQDIDRNGTTHEQIPTCLNTVHDQATGNCVGVSSVPTLGMLYPLGPDFYFDQFGQLRLGETLIVDGNVVVGAIAGTDVSVNGGDLSVYNGGRIGIGDIFPATDLHIDKRGSAEILIEADSNNTNEFAHPLITFLQDGGLVRSRIGYADGFNYLTIASDYDDDMRFELPLGGGADWEFWQKTGPGTDRKAYITNLGNMALDGNLFTGGADVAEYYPVADTVDPGDVVAFCGAGLELRRASAGDRARLAGIVSSEPGVVLGLTYSDESETGEDPEDLCAGDRLAAIRHEIRVNRRAPLALTGRVPCKVSDENGPIRPGDLLTVSSLPGHAMRATDSGAVVGTALQALRGGEGTILVLANLGWFSPTEDLEREVSELRLELERLSRRVATLSR